MPNLSPPPVPRREPTVLPADEPRAVLHSYCIDVKYMDDDHAAGAIRLCQHGKIQEMYEAPGVGKYWRDISQFLNPIRYHRAGNRLIAAGIARSL